MAARAATHRPGRCKHEVLSVRRALIRTARKWLYIGHRWIGIVTCLFFAMRFISGVVMMYVAFPGLSDKERLAALPDIAWDKVALSPDDAMRMAGATRYPRDLRLAMLADEPVYRLVDWDGKRRAISALDGRFITQVSGEAALAGASPPPAPSPITCAPRRSSSPTVCCPRTRGAATCSAASCAAPCAMLTSLAPRSR